MLDVHPCGYYAWSKVSLSKCDKTNQQLTGLIKQFWLESGCVYGYRKPRYRKGESHTIAPNRLQRQLNPLVPDEVWVTDITYIRTHEGWLYLAVVVDLFSRKVIGRSMHSQISKDIVLNALLMAVWRRQPKKQVMVHSDQGSQYTSQDWQALLKTHGLQGSMSRRGNCHDNAVAESLFQLLKRERIKRKIVSTRAYARSDIFDYIEMFYNSKRKHGSNNLLSPVEYETHYQERLESVWFIGGDSVAPYLQSVSTSSDHQVKNDCEIVFNDKLGGVELYFKRKPHSAILSALQASQFTYHKNVGSGMQIEPMKMCHLLNGWFLMSCKKMLFQFISKNPHHKKTTRGGCYEAQSINDGGITPCITRRLKGHLQPQPPLFEALYQAGYSVDAPLLTPVSLSLPGSTSAHITLPLISSLFLLPMLLCAHNTF